jgi:hypothetical protein
MKSKRPLLRVVGRRLRLPHSAYGDVQAASPKPMTSAPEEIDSLRPFFILAIAVLAAVVVVGVALVFAIDNWSERGQFGDMYGVLNTTFSGLAFSALVITLVLQRKELRLQRLELEMTRAELQKQAVAQTAHAKTALRAARIAALGSLYQSYAMLVGGGRAGLIGNNAINEMQQVQAELKALLNDAA